jgi:hypothetical protein
VQALPPSATMWSAGRWISHIAFPPEMASGHPGPRGPLRPLEAGKAGRPRPAPAGTRYVRCPVPGATSGRQISPGPATRLDGSRRCHPKMTQQPQRWSVPRSWQRPGPMVLANDSRAPPTSRGSICSCPGEAGRGRLSAIRAVIARAPPRMRTAFTGIESRARHWPHRSRSSASASLLARPLASRRPATRHGIPRPASNRGCPGIAHNEPPRRCL